MATKTRAMRRFWLVQRLKRTHRVPPANGKPTGVAALGRNPFGYGHLGDYDLDYMGSAEFEFGAIPEALDRLRKAGKKIVIETKDYNGHKLDFLWVEKEGDPFDDWVAWVEGKPRIDDYGYTSERRRCEGKESSYQLRGRLDGEDEPSWGWGCDVWWALNENVMWAFHDEGHLLRMLESAQGEKNVVRG